MTITNNSSTEWVCFRKSGNNGTNYVFDVKDGSIKIIDLLDYLVVEYNPNKKDDNIGEKSD